MYTILTTWPENGSGNVGDRLITESAKSFIEHEIGDVDYLQLFREEPLEPHLSEINSGEAVLLPGFAIREPIHPETYRLVDDLSKIEVPIIPLGTGWKSYPGDFLDNKTIEYNQETIEFIKKLSNKIPYISTREYYTNRVLTRHGISNTLMTGDCAWYDPESFGDSLHRPDNVQNIVFTTPHSSHYEGQAIDMIEMLTEEFPNATLYCSFHSELTSHEENIRNAAEERGFEIVHAASDLSAIEFYANADLHVGYRVHGHIAFLRKRRPSVLLSEDGRGVGFSETLGHKIFPAFTRHIAESAINNMNIEKVLQKTIERRRIASSTVVEEVRQYLQEEQKTGFRRLQHIPFVIDETYQNMQKVISSIPK